MEDYNQAQRHIFQRMRKNSLRDVPTTSQTSDTEQLADFIDSLQFVNSEMYDVVTGLTTDTKNQTRFEGKFGPILHRIQSLGKQASKLDFSHFSVFETSEIKQLRNSIETNNDNFKLNMTGKRGSPLTMNALNQLTNQVESLIKFIDLKLEQQYSLGPLQGSGYRLPRHLL
jgi:hypothetical protein